MKFSKVSDTLKNSLVNLKYSLSHYRRVLRRTKKPSKAEFIDVVKVTAIGMLVIGLIGFAVQTLFVYVIKV